jgi:hypothetical protein
VPVRLRLIAIAASACPFNMPDGCAGGSVTRTSTWVRCSIFLLVPAPLAARFGFGASPATSLGGFRTDITEDQIQGAPNFYRDRDYDWSDRQRERELHDYWKAPYYWGM